MFIVLVLYINVLVKFFFNLRIVKKKKKLKRDNIPEKLVISDIYENTICVRLKYLQNSQVFLTVYIIKTICIVCFT